MIWPTFCFWVVTMLLWKECNGFPCIDSLHEETGSDHSLTCPCHENGTGLTSKWIDPQGRTIGPQRSDRKNDPYVVILPQYTRITLTMMKSLNGLYKCIVTDSEGNQKRLELLEVSVVDRIIVSMPPHQYILKGQRSLIKCDVVSDPDLEIDTTWHLNDQDIDPAKNPKYYVAKEGLYVNNVTDNDKGNYECRVSYKEEASFDAKSSYVQIVTVPKITSLKLTPNKTTLITGESLKMACMSDGEPAPEYKWRRIDSEKEPKWTLEINLMKIDNVTLEDQGRYECIASNPYGNDSKFIDIQVLSPPSITSFESIVAKEYDTVQLVCNATGRPTPNIAIAFFGKDDDDRELRYDDAKENYSKMKVSRADAGTYICNASNEVDSTIMEMNLTVLYPPTIEKNVTLVWGWRGHSFNITCPYDSNPPGNVTWGFQGNQIIETSELENIIDWATKTNSDYLTLNLSSDSQIPFGIYMCFVDNGLGNATHNIHFVEGHTPTEIKNVTITATATSALFDIETPVGYEGPPVAAYIAEYDRREDYDVTSIHSNRTCMVYRPFVLEHLKPNISYSVRFAPINAVGYGPWSELYEFETEPPSAPEMPMWEKDIFAQEEIVNITDFNQVISWKIPENNGAKIEYFTVKFCPVDELTPCKKQNIHLDDELKLDLESLENNATYDVQLIAHNRMGDSMPVNMTIMMQVDTSQPKPFLSAVALICISIVVVLICLLLLDLLLLTWKRQGIIAHLCLRKRRKEAGDNLQPRDKKGLLKDSRDDSAMRPDNRHKEYEYNKTTGIITGKHSSV